ncbi:MAG: hypothetical protein AB8G96_01380 [Phycisphaerales bacterium]
MLPANDAVTCPNLAIPEDEPCMEDVNGGCNSIPVVFTEVGCGDTVCGTVWAEGGIRDTDWILPPPLAAGEVSRMTVTTEFRATISRSPIGCCEALCVLPVYTLEPGQTTYFEWAADVDEQIVWFIATEGFDRVPCPSEPGAPGTRWVATFDCLDEPTCIGNVDGMGDVGFSDVLTVLSNWGSSGFGDANGDNFVSFDDLLIVLAGWGPCG